MMQAEIIIVGAGLAGSEAAWQAACRGVRVRLLEMRPQRMTPAHHTGAFAELVCSNSFRSQAMENAVGLLKEEMRRLDSVIMTCADEQRVPAGGALAVDRQGFADCVTQRVSNHHLVTVDIGEVPAVPPRVQPVIVATGPLTSELLAWDIRTLTGEDYLYFYDAAAPIVTLDSLAQGRVFRASRYGKGGEGAYINCPFTREEYNCFWEALVEAEVHGTKDFEDKRFFEGCMPVEELARRGRDTLCYGPLKPVGLEDPRTGEQPYAVVQLRQDNREGTLYNMVGFQTRLKWGEQKRVFSLIPGLEQAEFVRYGVMHRNTFISAPRVLRDTYQFRGDGQLLFAGQITGVEGYVESAASGLVAGINAARIAQSLEPLQFPPETAHGALAHYITAANPKNFQPMNINFGLFPPLEARIKNRRERNRALAERALRTLGHFSKNLEI